MLAELRRRFPRDYAAIVEDFRQGKIKGQTEDEVAAALRNRVRSVILAKIPLADDDVVIDYGALVVEQLAALWNKDPKLCMLYLSGRQQDAYSAMPQTLIDRETAICARIIETAAERPPLSKEAAAEIRQKLGGDVKATELRLLGAKDVPPEEYAEVCRTAISIFQAPARLEPNETAAMLRQFWDGK